MAAARMGLRTALFTLNADLIAQMSCNPAVGGIAKGHLVREIDALGGIMGEVTDAVGIQFRLLNTSRGPAVWSPRAQCDKQQYRLKMREVLESQPNLKIKQAEVAELWVEDDPSPPQPNPPQPQKRRREVGHPKLALKVPHLRHANFARLRWESRPLAAFAACACATDVSFTPAPSWSPPARSSTASSIAVSRPIPQGAAASPPPACSAKTSRPSASAAAD